MNSRLHTFLELSTADARHRALPAKSNATLRFTGLAGAIVLLLLPACQQLPTQQMALPPVPKEGAALHAVHSEQLRGIMAGLNRLAFERLPQELDTAKRQRAELKKAAAIADAMVRSVDQIPGAADQIKLPPDEKKVFLTLAERMRHQVQTLDAQADRGEMRSVQATMQDLSGTCIACHALFRGSAIPINE